jgi:hypothetical protein
MVWRLPMLLFASALDEAGPRPWIWAVLAGLVLGGVLIAHAGSQIVRAFPDDVRANALAALKRRPRLVVVTAAIAGWTLIYALYSLAYPSGAALLGADAQQTGATVAASATDALPPPIADNRELLPPSIGGELALPSSATATVTPQPTPASTTTTTPPDSAAPEQPPTTEPAPCPVEAIANALGPQAVPILCPQGSTP